MYSLFIIQIMAFTIFMSTGIALAVISIRERFVN